MAIEQTIVASTRTLTLLSLVIDVESQQVAIKFRPSDEPADDVWVKVPTAQFGEAIDAIISATSAGQVLRKIEDYVLAQGLASGVRV